MFKKLKDPMSALTHFIGFVLGIPAIAVLIWNAAMYRSNLHVIAFTVFGITLLLLYSASTIYHSITGPIRISKILRKIDHMMIFVFIAGTYTPVCLITLKGTLGYSLLAVIWSIAILGIVLKIFWMNAPRWLYTIIYIAMGWTAVVVLYPLAMVLSFDALKWLFAGGIIYTVGAIIYATKKPNFHNKWFGFHEIFHIFIIGGTICHYIFMYKYIL